MCCISSRLTVLLYARHSVTPRAMHLLLIVIVIITRSVLASLAHSLVGHCMRSVDKCTFKFPAITAHTPDMLAKKRVVRIHASG